MSEIRTAIPDEMDEFFEAMVRTGPFGSKAELVRAALVSYAQSVGPLAHSFDKEIQYSPDGRLYQVEYARESAKRGSLVVGMVSGDGLLIGAAKRKPLGMPGVLLKDWERIVKLGPNVAVAGVGLAADSSALIRHLKKTMPQSTDSLMDEIKDYFWERTTQRDLRPLGCTVIVGSLLDGPPHLFQVDPSGSTAEVRYTAFGQGSEAALEILVEGVGDGKKTKDAETLVLKALQKPDSYELVRIAAGS